MKPFNIKTKIFIPKPLKEVFDFFKEAPNIEKITPSFLKFKILSPLPIKIKKGTLLDYQIKLFGIPMKWKTEITLWEPPVRFVDSQLKGPYKIWIHEHSFEKTKGGTIVYDKVEYFPRGGLILGNLAYYLFVSKQVKFIFAYRNEKIKEYFT